MPRRLHSPIAGLGASRVLLLIGIVAALGAIAWLLLEAGAGPPRAGPTGAPGDAAPAETLPAGATAPAAQSDRDSRTGAAAPPARRDVTAAAAVRGTFRAPAGGVWPGGGFAALYAVAPLPEGGFFGAMTAGMARTRQTGGGRAGLAPGFEQMFRRGDAAATTPLDPGGGFVFAEPPVGRHEVRLRHPRLRHAAVAEVDVQAGATHDVGTLDTELAGSLLVLVSDPDGQPVAGAAVQLGKSIDLNRFTDISALADLPTMFRDFIPLEQTADARGACRFEGLAQEDWTLGVAAPDLVEEVIDVHAPRGRETVVRVELTRGAQLVVTVTDPSGAPRPAARLRLEYPDRDGDGAAPTNTVRANRDRGSRLRTGDGGVARAGGLPPGRAVLRLQTPGYLPTERALELVRDATHEVSLQLDPGAVVAGRVVDEAGAPIGEAHVMHLAMLGQKMMGMDVGSMVGLDFLSLGVERRGVPVAADGSFTLGGFEPGGEAHLIAAAPHYDAARADARAGDRGVEIRLLRSTELRGTVVAAADEAAVAAFEVRLEQRSWVVFDRPVVLDTFEGRDDGRFVLPSVPRDRFRAVIAADGFARWSQSVDLRDGSVDLGTVRLERPAVIEGRTVDADGRPLAGVAVRVSKGGVADSMLMSKMFGQRIATSGADGRFRLDGLAGRRVRLLADLDGYAPTKSATIAIEKGQTTRDVVLQLGRGGELRGHIVDEAGAPLADWRVQVALLSGRSLHGARTDAAGHFALAGLAPGSHKIEAFPGDYMQRFRVGGAGLRPEDGEFNLSEVMDAAMRWSVRDQAVIRDGEVTEVELVFDTPREDEGSGFVDVEGHVRIGDDDLADGMVVLVPTGTGGQPRITPVRNGRFDLRRVRPGTFRVRVQTGLIAAAVGTPRVVTIPDETPYHLELALPGGRLAGIVVDPDGTPVAGVALDLATPAGAAPVIEGLDLGGGSQLTDTAGRFRFDGLDPGRYQVLAVELMSATGAERSGRLADLQLGAGDQRTDLRLVLQPAATLRIAVRDAAGPRANALVTILRADGTPIALFPRVLTDPGGVATTTGLPPGRYRAAIDAPRAAAVVTEAVVLQAGQVLDLDAVLPAGVEVVLRLASAAPARTGGIAVAYSVWQADGALLRSGRLALPAAAAAGAEISLGEVLPGSYRVRLEGPGGALDRREEVPAGDRVVLVLDPAGLLR